jgi:hypothetical protein
MYPEAVARVRALRNSALDQTGNNNVESIFVKWAVKNEVERGGELLGFMVFVRTLAKATVP